MPIAIVCSSCSVKLKVKDELRSKAVKCPKCGARITVADTAAHAAPPDPEETGDFAASSLDFDEETATFQRNHGKHPNDAAPANHLPTVPGYRVLREIARGGMGCVLAAFDLELERDV